MQEKILALAKQITGASEADLSLLETLCKAAETYWTLRLRTAFTPAGCSEAFCCAAAFTAAANLHAGKSGDGVGSFTAGNVSIKGKTGGERADDAAILRQTAERLMVPYTMPPAFHFKGVPG